jgi:hypothetical protein
MVGQLTFIFGEQRVRQAVQAKVSKIRRLLGEDGAH